MTPDHREGSQSLRLAFCGGQRKFHWDLSHLLTEAHRGGLWARHPWAHLTDDETESQRG